MNVSLKTKKYYFYPIVCAAATFLSYILLPDIVGNVFLFFFLLVIFYYSKKRPELLFGGLIIIDTNVFGAAPNKIFGILFDKLEIIVIIYAFLLWWRHGFINRKKIKKANFMLWGTLLIIIEAAIVAFFSIRQSIIFGILLQTRLLSLLIFFPITALCISRKEEAIKEIIKIITFLAAIQSVLCIIQTFSYPNIEFLVLTANDLRLGTIRVRYGAALIVLASLLTFSKLLKKISLKDVALIVLYLTELIYANKTRMIVIAILFAIFITTILSLRLKSSWKRIIILLVLIIALIPLYRGNLSQLLQTATSDVSENSGNVLVRNNEIEFYTSQVINPIVGRGYVSPKSVNGLRLDTNDAGYYSVSDIGYIGLYTTNGLIGIAWYLALLWIIVSNSKGTKFEAFYIAYFFYALFASITILSLYYGTVYLAALLTIKYFDGQ